MNLRYLVRLGLAALLGAVLNVAFAQQALEIIPLRYRTVEQVLPALQPLLEPGATLSGTRGQLFLRASAPNAEDIKRALAAIDRPAKRLQISVRVDDAFERERRSVEASGSIGSGGARVGVSAQDSRRTAAERVDQRLQVLEGSRATIFAGRSNDYQDAGSGFEVVPRLAGSGVILEIVQQRPHQAASSTINARLGEWVELAGISQSTARDDRGFGSASGRRASESRRVWLKVEALD
jgi:type II secretory pathway component GspD/PulD (secretin)